MTKENHTQLAIIGAGPGGYTAAFLATDLGLAVTLIDTKANPGGVCLHHGCISSKALLHAAKIISEARNAKALGINFSDPKIDIDQLRQWKEALVNKLTGGLGQLAKRRSVTFIQGSASFLDSKTLNIVTQDGPEQKLTFDNAIIATGSHPNIIPGISDSTHLLSSVEALDLQSIPKSLLLVGGGYIGLELGTAYAELGSRVDVVEMLPQIMTGADRDLVQIAQKRFQSLFNDIMISTKVVQTTENKDGITVTFEDNNGKSFSREYDKVLLAIGRSPNSEGIGLENTKVEVDEKSFVKVNTQRQTTDAVIYAIGDVAGNPMLAHKASHEGIVAVEVIAGKDTTFNPKAMPAVVFTDPEIAWCGLTETEAKDQSIEVEVAKFPWGASGRALTLNRTDGLTKLIVDPKTEKILGVAIVGPGAGELIAEGILAIEMGATASNLKNCIHPHPTLSETLMESAESFYGLATHIYRPKKK